MTEISRHDQNPLSVQQSINRIMSLPLKSFYTSILTKEETDEQNTMQLKQFVLEMPTNRRHSVVVGKEDLISHLQL